MTARQTIRGAARQAPPPTVQQLTLVPTPARPKPTPAPPRAFVSALSTVAATGNLLQELEAPAGEPVAVDPAHTYTPILPFLGVLLRGLDAPLFHPRRLAPRYHPSVGYARDVYVAVAMNGLVDAVGFTFLFHAYLVGWGSTVAAWMLASCLAAVFTVAFATFAVSLVRKPLRLPRWRPVPATVGLVSLGIGVLLFTSGVLLPMAAIALLVGVMLCAVSLFGPQDGALVSTRAAVMFGVAGLVAEPLHEAMFAKEIDRSFREQSAETLRMAIDAVETDRDALTTRLFDTCMRTHGLPTDPGCSLPQAEFAKAELLAQAIAFVKAQERNGDDAGGTRAFLLNAAEPLGATAVVALLGPGATGQAGRGPRYQQALAQEGEALRHQRSARVRAEGCGEAVATCEAQTAAEPRLAALTAQAATLQGKAAALQSGEAEPGAIERATALEALVKGHAAGGASAVHGKLLAAWFLALAMPLIVLVMKLSAGDKLEPYLRRRWAGR